MAALSDVAQRSAELTGENTPLSPWRPQQEGCCHSEAGALPGGHARETWGSKRHGPIFISGILKKNGAFFWTVMTSHLDTVAELAFFSSDLGFRRHSTDKAVTQSQDKSLRQNITNLQEHLEARL